MLELIRGDDTIITIGFEGTTQLPELVDVGNTGNVKSDNFFITNQQ